MLTPQEIARRQKEMERQQREEKAIEDYRQASLTAIHNCVGEQRKAAFAALNKANKNMCKVLGEAKANELMREISREALKSRGLIRG